MESFIKDFSKRGLELIKEKELYRLDSFVLFLDSTIFGGNVLYQFSECVNLTQIPEEEWTASINIYLSRTSAVSFILVKKMDEDSRLLYLFHLAKLHSAYETDDELMGLPKEVDSEEAIKHLSIESSLPIIH